MVIQPFGHQMRSLPSWSNWRGDHIANLKIGLDLTTQFCDEPLHLKSLAKEDLSTSNVYRS